MVKKRRRPKKKQAKKIPATVHHKHKSHKVHEVHHTPQVHHPSQTHHVHHEHQTHHSPQEHVGNSTERVLVQNFVSLQKVMVNLSEKLIVLNNQISKLLDLFEVSARTLAKKDFDLGKREKEDTKKIIDKLENLSEQNKIIAKGLTLIHENRQGGLNTDEPMTFEQEESKEEPQEEQKPMMEDLPAPPKPWQMSPAPFMQKTQNQNQMQFKLPPLEKMPTPIKTIPVNPNPMNQNQNNFTRRNMNPPSPGFVKARRQEIEPAVPEMESADLTLPELPEEMPEIGETENSSDDFEEMSSDSSPFTGK